MSFSAKNRTRHRLARQDGPVSNGKRGPAAIHIRIALAADGMVWIGNVAVAMLGANWSRAANHFENRSRLEARLTP